MVKHSLHTKRLARN